MSGLALWRLVAGDGRMAEAYLDLSGADEWMLTMWRQMDLVGATVPRREAARGVTGARTS